MEKDKKEKLVEQLDSLIAEAGIYRSRVITGVHGWRDSEDFNRVLNRTSREVNIAETPESNKEEVWR